MHENRPEIWRSGLAFFLFATAAYLLYMQVFSGLWLMDDYPVVVNNPDIRSFANFLENYYPDRPLRELTYLIDYAFFGLQPAGYYLQHIFWHSLCAWLVFRLGRQLGAAAPVAWFAALLFLFHPVQVEVVANISHRKDSLALAFCLLAFMAYLHARTFASPRWRWWLLGSLLLWGVALLAKQNALALPLVVVAYEMYELPRQYRRSILPVFASIASLGLVGRLVYLANDQTFKESIAPALLKLGYLTDGSVTKYFLTVFKGWAFMASKLIYPAELSMEYTFPIPVQWGDPWVLCGLVGAAAALLGLFWAGRCSTAIYVPLAWSLAFWLPTSNLLGHLSYFAADRYWYAPLAGLSLLVSGGLWRLLRANLGTFAVFAILILSLLGWRTWQQQIFWSDAVMFYEHMLQVNPESLEGLVGRGAIAMDRGDYLEATNSFQKALRRSPQDARIPHNLGYIAYMQGDYATAEAYFQQSLHIDPELLDAYNNLGSVYDDLGQPARAIEALEKALVINNHFENAYTNLGVVYERMGLLQKAESFHRRALSERPDYGQAHYNLGNTLYRAGRKQEALESYLMATRFLPENADALYNYAVVASELGQKNLLPGLVARLRVINPQLAAELEKSLTEAP